jgi:hypothetical protein
VEVFLAKGDMLRNSGKRSVARLAIVASALVVAVSGGVWGEARTGEVKTPSVASVDFKAQSAVVIDPDTHKTTLLVVHQRVGDWTLMAVVQLLAGDSAAGTAAVFEDVVSAKGSIEYVGVGKQGVLLTLPKSLEPTSVPEGTLFRGKTVGEIANIESDFLATDLLAGAGSADPSYNDVAAALPPLRVPSFVGTRHSDDKPTYDYGGFSDEIYLDVGKLFPDIRAARARHDVGEGLIGGWLPVLRFVFPAGADRQFEETIFAEEAPGHFWTQPVWYRVLRVESGEVKEAHYYYHHLPFPPRKEPPASAFFEALFHVHAVWKHDLNPAMKIDVPDPRIAALCLRSFSLQMITRVEDHPKYGYPPLGGINVFGGYGYNNVDTFQDTFNSDVSAFMEWGMFDIAGRYIDDYFTNSVRNDGSIDTRGPEIGQYGKMLSVMGKYYALSNDSRLLRKYQKKLEAIVDLFYTLRKEAKDRPTTDISYGIVRGWTEHDSSLKIDPYRFMLPHYSNNAFASRGFRDLGGAWIEIGRKSSDKGLAAEGRRMLEEADAMKKDMDASIEKSIDTTQNPPYMPAVAGDTPTYGKARAYSELLESGLLTQDKAKIVLDHWAAHGGTAFGLPRFGKDNVGGFLDFGPAYVRLQFDAVREFILLYYAHMAHVYSPGTWTSVESAKMDGTVGGPYCTPSQDTIPIFTKWMLVFEDPNQDVVWLARATPREWLAPGKKIAVQSAPTRFGNISYEIHSAIDRGSVSATVDFPAGYKAATQLRCRVPEGKQIRSVTLNGEPWAKFSAEQESILIPAGAKAHISLEISY